MCLALGVAVATAQMVLLLHPAGSGLVAGAGTGGRGHSGANGCNEDAPGTGKMAGSGTGGRGHSGANGCNEDAPGTGKMAGSP